MRVSEVAVGGRSRASRRTGKTPRVAERSGPSSRPRPPSSSVPRRHDGNVTCSCVWWPPRPVAHGERGAMAGKPAALAELANEPRDLTGGSTFSSTKRQKKSPRPGCARGGRRDPRQARGGPAWRGMPGERRRSTRSSRRRFRCREVTAGTSEPRNLGRLRALRKPGQPARGLEAESRTSMQRSATCRRSTTTRRLRGSRFAVPIYSLSDGTAR